MVDVNISIATDPCKHSDFACPGYVKCLSEQGWATYFSAGGDGCGLTVTSFRKKEDGKDYQYLILLEDPNEYSPLLWIGDTISFLEAYAKYVSLVKDSAIAEIAEGVFGNPGTPNNHGVVEQIAARVKYGLGNTYDWMMRNKAAAQDKARG